MPGQPGLVVVGLGAAGVAAAKAFREKDAHTSVQVVSAEQISCYSRPRLPEVVSGQAMPEAICLYPDAWYADQRIELVLGQAAVGLDVQRREVTLADARVLPYSQLILATGAEANWPSIQGLPSPHLSVLRSLEDAQQLRQRAQGKKHAFLIGGGLLGLEAGYALTKLGLRVTVLETFSRLLPRQVDQEGSDLLQERLRAQGFDFLLGATIDKIEADEKHVCLYLADGQQYTAELAVFSAGIIPRITLAQAAGVRVQRGIVVDAWMRTSAERVWAAGDAAEWNGQVAGLWPAAQAMGRIAGLNAAGSQEAYRGWVPSTRLKVAGVDLCSQGTIDPQGALIITRGDQAQGWLCKLFVREDRLVGSIQIGRTTGATQFKRLMEAQLPLQGMTSELLEDGFDFNRIPGFR